MYCPTCRRKFVGWTRTCPECQVPLFHELPPLAQKAGQPIAYAALVDLVREQGGQLSVEITATEVGRQHTWNFPYFGYGYAWARHMQGTLNDVLVDLDTTKVGRQHVQRFPYQGYGFAWVKEMHGEIGGNKVHLAATKVDREMKWTFPYFGYGYAWTEELTGTCGDQLRATLRITGVGRQREQRFLFRGYGFAWEKRGTFVLALVE